MFETLAWAEDLLRSLRQQALAGAVDEPQRLRAVEREDRDVNLHNHRAQQRARLRSLLTVLGYHNDLPRVAAMIDSGLLEPSSMITSRAPLAETPAEIERLATDPGDDVKVLIEFGG